MSSIVPDASGAYYEHLVQAIQANDLVQIDQLLASENFDPSYKIQSRHQSTKQQATAKTAFQIACQFGSDAVVLRFWKQSKNLYLTSFSPFYAVVSHDRVAVMKVLLADGLSANHHNEQGTTLLFFAHSRAMIELLVSQGAQVDAMDEDGDIPICHMVVGRNGPASVHALADLGFDITTMRCSDSPILSIALHEASDETVVALMERGCRMPALSRGDVKPEIEWFDLASRARRSSAVADVAKQQYPDSDFESFITGQAI